MTRCLMTLCFAVLIVSATLAQEKKTVPPPPKPADEGPSLEVTMKFIQDKMNDTGQIIYAESRHDIATREDYLRRKAAKIENVIVDSGSCSVSFRRLEGDLFTTTELINDENHNLGRVDVIVSLKDVADITVIPDIDEENQRWGGMWTVTQIAPPISVLRISTNHRIKMVNPMNPTEITTKQVDLKFLEGKMVDRVAKALQHAAELCGAGTDEPF